MESKIYRIPTKKGYAKIRLDKGKSWQDVYGKQRCRKCKQHFQESEVYTFMENDTRHFQHIDCKHPKEITDLVPFVVEEPKPAKKSKTVKKSKPDKKSKPVKKSKPIKKSKTVKKKKARSPQSVKRDITRRIKK